MAKKKATFVCQNCGYNSPKYLGRCPNCGSWSSFVEEVEVAEVKNARVSLTGEKTKPMKLAEVTSINVNRTKTEMEEFNRVLGGGVVPGSLVLIGGDPGIGKSTLLLQVSTQLSQVGTVLYVSGEESAQQIKLRAERLGDIDSEFYLYAETNMQSVRAEVERIQPDFLIIDSIQTIMSPEISGVQGSVSQVREVTAELMQLAKTNNIAIFIVGHVTKEGTLAGPRMLEHMVDTVLYFEGERHHTLAGPRMLEHMVDTVLYFEGERHHTFRILRAVKNRFGSTNEIGIFEMQSGGLVEVLNPSQVFLEERLDGATGSSIVVTMEGTRPILAEVQALVTPTMFGNAKRTTTGLDFNRASLIMAVLEKRAGLLLQNQDAYLKSAGGVKLDEPAIDLAVAVAIASSYKDKPTNPQECFVGELGLTGEIRRVNRIEQRINEAAKLGFTKIYVPKNSLTGITLPKEIQVIGVTTIQEVLKKVFA
ncbi:TPA: DNA repair protein RadA [Streptococcus pneumoniae]